MSTCPFGHMGIWTYGRVDIFRHVDMWTFRHIWTYCMYIIEKDNSSSYSWRIFSHYMFCMFYSFCLFIRFSYTICPFIPFVIIHFVFLYVLPLYVSSLYTFCHYTFWRYTFCRYTFCRYTSFFKFCCYTFCLCSVSRWRPHKVDKRMVLEYTHGLFIT